MGLTQTQLRLIMNIALDNFKRELKTAGYSSFSVSTSNSGVTLHFQESLYDVEEKRPRFWLVFDSLGIDNANLTETSAHFGIFPPELPEGDYDLTDII